ncbi:MAG: isochorismatase family protein [Kofleriaceae bacterium]|nr:isochorismatase family protein [Kofleriaceae bacterium]
MPTSRSGSTSPLSAHRAVVLVIDVQERLCAAMPPAVADAVIRNTSTLVATAARFDLPVIVSQQYPRGLGPTVAALEDVLATLPTPARRLDKLEFSVGREPAFSTWATELARAGRDQWLVTGMETHVCVLQSVRDLLAAQPGGRPAEVGLVVDAACSRSKGNWRVGLALAERAGASLSSTETALFELLGRAGTDDFKALSKLIR